MKKMRKYVGIFAKLRHFVPRKTLLNLYFALIYPHLIYCSEVWGEMQSHVVFLQSILKLQKKIVRIITFSDFHEHAQPLFTKYGMLNIFDIYKYHVAQLAHKQISG